MRWHAVGVPNTPLLSELFEDGPERPRQVPLKSWLGPLKKWDDWVEQLAGKFGVVWHRAGITDAIMKPFKTLIKSHRRACYATASLIFVR